MVRCEAPGGNLGPLLLAQEHQVGFTLWYCDRCRTYFLRPAHWARNDAHRQGEFGYLCTGIAAIAGEKDHDAVLAAFAIGGKPAVEAMGHTVD